MSRPVVVRPSVALHSALAGHEALGALLQRLRRSQDNLAAVRDVLPPGLRGQVRAGPLDDEGWTLLVPGSAAAAKLRQCLPLLESRLAERGLGVGALRVRIHRPEEPV